MTFLIDSFPAIEKNKDQEAREKKQKERKRKDFRPSLRLVRLGRKRRIRLWWKKNKRQITQARKEKF